jgi:spoIIIJ-associated protein
MKVVIKSARTKDEAIRLALNELGCTEAEAIVEVLEEASKGLFGLLGAKDAKVKVTKIEPVEITNAEKSAIETKKAIEKTERPSAAPQRASKPAAAGADKTSEFLSNVTALMGVPAEVKRTETDEYVQFILSGEHMGTLIGRRGDTLDALQYLANIISNKSHEADRKRIILDAEGYRSRREETLTRLAKRLAARVKRTGHKVVLEPMSPLERRLIHTALQNDPEVKTLSEGEEPYRRLVISPASGSTRSYSSERKSSDRPQTPKKPSPTYTSERRFSERPPKRTYTNIEDVDVPSDRNGKDKSTLW